MKHKFMCLLLLCFLSAGCNRESRDILNTDVKDGLQNVTMTSFPSSYNFNDEHVSIHLLSIEPKEAYFVEGIARSMALDYEHIGRMLMPDDGSNEINSENKQILSKEMIDDAFYREMYIWGKDYGEYYTYHGIQLSSGLNSEKKVNDYNLPLYSEKRAFSFGKEQDALEEIKAFLSEAGILLDADYLVDTYYLNHETLREQEKQDHADENAEDAFYKSDWSEADDAYFFYIHQTYCGLEDYHNGDFWKGRVEDSNAQITVLYGADGIEYMCIQNMSDYMVGTEQKKLLDFESVIQNVITFFDNILDDAFYEVTEAKLISDYKTSNSDGGKVIEPVWAFHVMETLEDGTITNYELRVNALTGRIQQSE